MIRSMTSYEPRFSRIAAQIADPSRSRMLAVLLSGEHRSAGELARAAGITAQAASTQLAQLVSNALVSVRQQGRHKYFALANSEVAHALEALALVAESDPVATRWCKPTFQPLKCARRCYGHLAGELGVAQFEMLMRCRRLEFTAQGLQFTAGGQAWAAQLQLKDGLKLAGRTRLAYPCMDWSERREHLAGTLATALLAHHVASDWLRTDPQSRALTLTPKGERELLPWLAAG
jgi:DNA-binding transcriptional ArsR family regulator